MSKISKYILYYVDYTYFVDNKTKALRSDRRNSKGEGVQSGCPTRS